MNINPEINEIRYHPTPKEIEILSLYREVYYQQPSRTAERNMVAKFCSDVLHSEHWPTEKVRVCTSQMSAFLSQIAMPHK